MWTILVVDDSRLIRGIVVAALQRLALTVREAANGAEALTMCAESVVDVVLLDHEMPGEYGLAVCSALKRTTPALPVVLMSGHGREVLCEAIGSPPDFFLHKPFTLDELEQVVWAAMGNGGRTHP